MIFPIRALPVPFAATLYGTGTLLKPVVAPVSVIHGVTVDAAHEQPFGVFRIGVKLNEPPGADTVCDAGVSV